MEIEANASLSSLLVKNSLQVNKMGNVCLFLIDLLYPSEPRIIRTYMKAFVGMISLALMKKNKLIRRQFVIETVTIEYMRQVTLGLKIEDKLKKIKEDDVSPEFNEDFDRMICVSEDFINTYMLSCNQWVSLQKVSSESLTGNGFVCKVVAHEISSQPGIEPLSYNRLIRMTPTAVHNLKRSFGLVPYDCPKSLSCKIFPLLCNPAINNLKHLGFEPNEAKTVRLSCLKSTSEITAEASDKLIKNYFEYKKHISVGDVISIPVSISNNDRRTEDETLCLAVTEIEGENGSKKFVNIFSASIRYTTVYLTGIDVNDYRPRIFHWGIDSIPPYTPIDLASPALGNYCDKLYDWLQSALKASKPLGDLWPSVLVYGPVGSGKFLVCKTAAQMLGLNFYFVNAVNLVGDTSSYTEAKLKALYQKIQSISPCLVLVKNIQLLGKDKEGQEDKRVLFAFADLLMDIQKSIAMVNEQERPYPLAVFVVGASSNPEKMSTSLKHNFLYKLDMTSPVSLPDLASTVKWLLNKGRVDISNDLDLVRWVDTNCHGSKINMGDLKAFVAIATRKAYEEKTTEISETDRHPDALCMRSCSPYEKLVITENHLRHALGALDKVMKSNISNIQIPHVTWEDIGGLGSIKSELINSIQLPLRFPNLFASGLTRSGILLYGPPGTGKTLIAKAVATEFKLNFLSVKGPELLNMYVGQSEKNVREVFERARNYAPCVIFFDELDSLAPNRGRNGDSGGVMDRVVSQILAELDGTHSTPNVFVIGATNRPDLIDSALLRPGRFDKLLYVGVTNDKESREKILKALTRKFVLSPDVQLGCIAANLPHGMTGADLYSLCSDAYMTAVSRQIARIEAGETAERPDKNSSLMVTGEDFIEASSRATVSLSKAEQLKYENLKSMMR